MLTNNVIVACLALIGEEEAVPKGGEVPWGSCEWLWEIWVREREKDECDYERVVLRVTEMRAKEQQKKKQGRNAKFHSLSGWEISCITEIVIVWLSQSHLVTEWARMQRVLVRTSVQDKTQKTKSRHNRKTPKRVWQATNPPFCFNVFALPSLVCLAASSPHQACHTRFETEVGCGCHCLHQLPSCQCINQLSLVSFDPLGLRWYWRS